MIALVEGPKQSVGDILEEPVSASRINCFHSCRMKFFFRYIQKIQKPVRRSKSGVNVDGSENPPVLKTSRRHSILTGKAIRMKIL